MMNDRNYCTVSRLFWMGAADLEDNFQAVQAAINSGRIIREAEKKALDR